MRASLYRLRTIVPIVLVAGSAVGFSAIVLSRAAADVSASQARPELIQAPAAASSDTAPHYIGSGSCAARACHGSPTLSPGREWNSAYAIWSARDPHAQAYSVLFTPESKRMAAALGLGEASKAERCLACHSLPMAHSAAALNVASSLLSDGVGCEACHGPADNYLAAHTMRGWRKMGAARFDSKFGMKNTADITARAQVCAGCHVGQPDADGRPWRDVNHDLIAAGHPRLNFEFSAYMAMLAPHWNTKVDKQRFDELTSWIVGQMTTSHAALRLLECRAQAAAATTRDSKGETGKSPVPSAWPELCEYDCYACHHELGGKTWRQEVAAVDRQASPFDRPVKKSGAPAWGTWYFEGPRVIAHSALFSTDGRSTGLTDRLNDLTVTMEKPLPPTDEVVAESGACQQLLQNLDQSTKPLQLDSARVRRALLKSLAEKLDRRKPESWDEFVQNYLALVVIYRSEVESACSKVNAEHDQRIHDVLEAIRNRLSFPADTTPGAQPPSTELRVLQPGINSPGQFDPNSGGGGKVANRGSEKNLFELFDEAFRLLSGGPTS